MRQVRIIEEHDYGNIVISIKCSDIYLCARAHELIAQETDYPLHVGITEAGLLLHGAVKSAIGMSMILSQGIGDTVRVSLTDDPVNEVVVAKDILNTLKLRRGGIEVISCPTCGRTRIDLISLAKQVETAVAHIDKSLTVAVMGCVVNGPGEAMHADIGIAGGIGEGLIIKGGQILRKVPESELVTELLHEIEGL
jgi:(E)-4-hydroxy-3-methylbut-2-enyl-diphosphate synthase